jgi:hypothetical protein
MFVVQRSWLKYLAIGVLATTVLWYIILYSDSETVSGILPAKPDWTKGGLGSLIGGGKDDNDGLPAFRRPDDHPISELIEGARARFVGLLGKRSLSVEQAAHRYRERRGRHPPPGFDVWFDAAKRKNAIIVEEFFDRIHHDINPFWALDPLEVRRQAHEQPQLIRVRGGKADFITDDPNRPEWIQLWTKLVQEMMPHLPDLDMVINVMDESRVLVPWETTAEHVVKEQRSRVLFPVHEANDTFTGYDELDQNPQPYDPEWKSDALRFWDYYAATCPPDSPARKVRSLATQDDPIADLYPRWPPAYMHQGFIRNASAARDPCVQPHLRGMHGTFVEPVSMATATQPFPMFGGSKLPGNGELLLPGAMYLTDRELYSGGNGHGGAWADKRGGLVWRGVASGGRNKAENWWHFQRHRLVQMLNGTTVARVEAGDAGAGPSFVLHPAVAPELLHASGAATLGARVAQYADVGFTSLVCFPEQRDAATGAGLATCPYTSPHMAIADRVPMSEQYGWKYLVDVDGNSFSARWRGFLLSTSLPVKATVYTEWHDDRLEPWLHYVPVDNTFADLYAVMDYFLGGASGVDDDDKGHDAEAHRIAHEGADWATKVLRHEDMMLYVWRLLLEYARVVDPARDRLGYVADLTGAA